MEERVSLDSIDKKLLQKPCLKWVGGKTQYIDILLSNFPKSIQNYHELFLGGGSVLLAVLSLQKQNILHIENKLYAYDANERLIIMYKHIQSEKEKLFEYIEKYIYIYDNIKGTTIIRNPLTIEEANTSKESYYYWLRKKFNTIDIKSIESSALFMILNKLCFRGVYREGKNGFNVPYGHYKKTPCIITKNELDILSNLIQNVEFICCDFTISIQSIHKGDFVYLDPPYFPENSTSFVGYTKYGFDMEQHKHLFNNIRELDTKKCKFCLSNSYVDFVLNSLSGFPYIEITAKRLIHSKNPETKTKEIIMYNY